MSMATLELPRQTAPAEAPFAGGNNNNNMFLAALRRWPLLVLGLVVGLGGGFLAFSVQAPKFQSTAQIAIYKKNVRDANGGIRTGVFEDYISAQIDTIRSQRILGASSKSPLLNQLTTPLPSDRVVAADTIKGGFAVTRSREVSGGGAVSPVINLTYTGKDPQDTQHVLQAVIDTYIKELSAAYSSETLERLRLNEDTIRRNAQKKLEEDNKRNRLEAERNEITTENEDAINVRITSNRNQIDRLALSIEDFQGKLDSIEKVGKNRSDRIAALALFNVPRGIGRDLSLNSPEVQIQLLLAKKKNLIQGGLGKDHEKVRAVEGEVELYEGLQALQNPDATKGQNDELSQVEMHFRFEMETAKRQKALIEANYASDSDIFRRSRAKTIASNSHKQTIDNLDREIAILEKERITIESTETIGGFTAQQLIEPQAGGKVAPVLLQWLALGGILGLMLGFGLSMLVELSDKSFRSPAEIRQRLGVPVIGHIPAIRLDLPSEADVPDEYSDTLVSARRPKSIEAEAYRGVRTQLSVITQNSGHQVIQVTSPNPGDGKSTLAANLAISIAQSGKRCILLDCDFRKPRVHKLFAITRPELGLASVTGGLANLAQAIRHSSIDNLDILPCGPRPQNPAELLSGVRFQQVLADLRQQYDYVIVDTPPMLAVSDPRVVAQRVDGILLVFKITKRARPLAERAREQLADMGANLLGVIVNGGGQKRGDEYGYSYGYNYAYSYEYEYAETYVDVDDPLDPNGSGKIVL